MPPSVLIVPDKFKGTLTASQAAELIAEGWREERPKDTLELLPMSDGGDGFGDVLSFLLDVTVQTTRTVNPVHKTLDAQWWWEAETKTAIIETAQVIGLALLPPKVFHPFELDTFGLGAVFQAAARLGAVRCLIGIGGSATNDAGFGLARSLDWKFLDANDRLIESWLHLESLQRIVPPQEPGPAGEMIVAMDVQNPLLGPRGASRIYGPQKGLRPEDMPRAERCLEQLAEVVERDLQLDAANEPGAGAAGGLGFGLRCFLGARLVSGFELFARYASLEERIRKSNLVITGEGSIDASTAMGKGVGEVAGLCRKHGVPCFGLAGTVTDATIQELVPGTFTRLMGMTPHLTTGEEARENPNCWLPRLAREAAQQHSSAGS